MPLSAIAFKSLSEKKLKLILLFPLGKMAGIPVA